MSQWARREARAWAAVVAAIALHEVLARALDHVGLVERLLSPSGAGLALPLVAALVMYGLRLALLFVAPGWLVARAVVAWWERRPR